MIGPAKSAPLEFMISDFISAYMEEAKAAAQADKAKEEKLSPDGILLRSLLKYREGFEALETYTAKEHASENLKYAYLPSISFRFGLSWVP